MYLVSTDYDAAIYSSPRTTYGRVTFDISPIGIEDDTPTIAVSSQYFVSNAQNQVTDNIRQSSLYLVSWEDNRTLLNGLFSFPSNSATEWGEVGWVSNNICTSNKEFASIVPIAYPLALLSSPSSETITLTYANSYTSAGVTITFDPLLNEYATDFVITAYNASDTVVYTTTVTGNTLVQYVLQQAINNFKKIKIEVKKWSVAYRRARIVEIDAGVVLVYENDKLIKMNSTEELDPLSSTLVIPEFSFIVNNIDGEFDILNPTGIYSSLQLRQRIQAEIGLGLTDRIEWVPIGIYYLSEWRSDTGAMTATFRGRSKLDLLESTSYENLTPRISYSLYDMAIEVLAAANITGYSIDIGLDSILTNGLVSNKSCKEILQLIAMAGMATIRVTRQDILTLSMFNALAPTNGAIDFDAMKEEPQIEQGKAVDSVSVTYFTAINTIGGVVTVTNAGVIKGEVVSLSTNTLINTNGQATDVANWLNDRRSQAKEFTINYRGNPAIELNDYLEIENRYTTGQLMNVTKIDLTYEGYLYAQIKGKAAN